MTIAELQVIVNDLQAQATQNTDVESAAATLIAALGQLLIDNAGNPTIIAAIGEAMTSTKGALKNSADSLAAAIVAGTPVA
jgi:uncharacterized protein YqfA (UPF0365 family)